MAKVRNAMLVAALAATACAGLGGYFFLHGPPSRLLIDAGLAVALAIVISFTMSPTLARVDALVEALRALARGEKHQRVNPDDFAGLADVARALNEVAASLTESDDPNLGPVRSTPRTLPTTHKVRRPARDVAGPEISEHPDIGPVRVMKKTEPKTGPKTEPKTEPKPDAGSSAARSQPPVNGSARGASTSSPPRAGEAGNGAAPSSAPPATASEPPRPSRDGSARPEEAAPSNDTAIDDAPRGGAPSGEPSGEENAGEAEVAKIPSRGELEALFQEFVARKKSKDESVVDLDLDAFAQTIEGECERLIAAHQCKGVRFEVAEVDGEVSLRPRLLR